MTTRQRTIAARGRAGAAVSGALALLALVASPAAAQLRIVDYNIAQNSTFNSDPTGLNLILTAIAAEVRNGIAKPIDILANQELHENGTEAAFIVGQLNAIYGAGTYAAAPVPANAVTGGNGLPSLIYNTTTVSLLDTLAFGNVGSGPTQQPRSTLRYHLRPVGYDAAADFYIYNSHYKSDDGSTDKARRLVEATSIRTDADALGDSAYALYVGDYNIANPNEDMFVKLLSAGPGQAVDPLNLSSWSGSSNRVYHTQSPAVAPPPGEPLPFPGQVTGGMNSRFDFQLITTELNDGEGMSLIPNSYHAFGNNGTHTYNGAITTGTGAAANVLSALATVSDHIPVVADYQLPAKMNVQFGSFPTTASVGASIPINVLVQNIASALTAASADELDYIVSVSGDLMGTASGTIFALANGNAHQVMVNTATAGLKQGMITVTATSQAAANPLFTLPVSVQVGAGGGPPPLPPPSVMRMTVAKDDFDAPLNLTSFVQAPLPNTYTSNTRGFQRYQVGVGATIPTQLRDDSTNGFPTDTIGVINTATKLDGWFGVADTVNPDNPSGVGTATWTFNVAGASALEVSIDMAAMGNFESSTVNPDSFNWTYSVDGAAFKPLFTSMVDESASATYAMAGGTVVSADDPLFMTNTANVTVQLTNVLTTLTSAIPEVGSVLTLRFIAATDGTGSSITDGEAYAFDNIVITGNVSFLAADFNKDGLVNRNDLLAWQNNMGLASGASKAQGDADNDGDVDGADLLVWQRQLGTTLAAAAAAAVPEPSAAALLGGALAGLAWARRRRGSANAAA